MWKKWKCNNGTLLFDAVSSLNKLVTLLTNKLEDGMNVAKLQTEKIEMQNNIISNLQEFDLRVKPYQQQDQ